MKRIWLCLFVAGIALVGQALAKKSCTKPCTYQSCFAPQPTCAKNKCGKLKDFGDPCQLNNYICDHPNEGWKFLYHDKCKKKLSCEYQYCLAPKPICAQNAAGEYKDFGDPCELHNYQCDHPKEKWVLQYQGKCKTCEPQCEYQNCYAPQPTCAQNAAGEFMDFGDPCQLNNYNCDHPQDQYVLQFYGVCNKPQCYYQYCYVQQPTCARNYAGQFMDFGDPCQLNNYNCDHPEDQYVLQFYGVCNNKPQCDYQYCYVQQPTCAQNATGEYKDFGDPCQLNNYNCDHPEDQYVLQFYGVCNNKPQCDYQYCYVQQPTCAQNATGEYKDFGDPCQLNNYNCDHPEDQYVLQFYGVCNNKPQCDYQYCYVQQPTCAQNARGEYKDFGDPCQLNNYNCDHPEDQYVLQFYGVCNNKPQCDYQYCYVQQPTCAQNATGEYKDFGDPCQLNNYNCDHPEDQYVLQFYGVCNNKPQCDYQYCYVQQPTCAQNATGEYKDFGDPCQLNNYNCDHPEDQYVLQFYGVCNNKPQCDYQYCYVQQPTCAQNSAGQLMDFGDECQLNNYNCDHPDDQYVMLFSGVCKKPDDCGFRYCFAPQPTCAQNAAGELRDFRDPCALHNLQCEHPEEGWVLQYQGKCKNCEPKCAHQYCYVQQPTCAKNTAGEYKDFGDQCQLNNYNCDHPGEGWQIAFSGKC